jgi:hypothetical protein
VFDLTRAILRGILILQRLVLNLYRLHCSTITPPLG